MSQRKKPALSTIAANLRKAPATQVAVVSDGATYTLTAAAVLVAREGLMAVETGIGRFRALEPELSDHCGAPTKAEIESDPKMATHNPYTDSEHEGYKAVRALLKASDPAVALAEEYVAKHEKDDPIKLAGDEDYTFAMNVKEGWRSREAAAIGWLYKAFKTRVGIVKQTSEPDGTTTLVKDFAEKMRKRGEGKQKGVPEADVKLARFWYNLLDWALQNHQAAYEASYRHSLGLKTPPPNKQDKAGGVKQMSAEQLSAVNAAIAAQLEKGEQPVEG